MRLHQTMVRAANAVIEEEKRASTQEVFDDVPTTTLEAMNAAMPGLIMDKKIQDYNYTRKQMEIGKEELKKSNPPLYEEMYGSEESSSKGGLFSRMNFGLFRRKDDKPVLEGVGKSKTSAEEPPVASTLEEASKNDDTFRGRRDAKKDDNFYIPKDQLGNANKFLNESAEYNQVDINMLPRSASNIDVSQYKDSASFIGDLEGFSPKAYYDVNAFRVGFGTDTLYTETDSVKVDKNTTITKEAAVKQLDLDLEKRFRPELRNKFGEEYYNSLPQGVRSSLESIAYNAGSDLNDPSGVITQAIKDGDFTRASNLIEMSLPPNHELYGRRLKEAAMMRTSMNEVYTQGLSPEKAEMFHQFNDDVANVLGFKDTQEYREFMRENIISYDESGSTVINPKVYEKLNEYINISVDFINQSRIGRAVQDYNEILRREKDYELGYNPNTTSPIGNNNPNQTMDMSE